MSRVNCGHQKFHHRLDESKQHEGHCAPRKNSHTLSASSPDDASSCARSFFSGRDDDDTRVWSRAAWGVSDIGNVIGVDVPRFVKA